MDTWDMVTIRICLVGLISVSDNNINAIHISLVSFPRGLLTFPAFPDKNKIAVSFNILQINSHHGSLTPVVLLHCHCSTCSFPRTFLR